MKVKKDMYCDDQLTNRIFFEETENCYDSYFLFNRFLTNYGDGEYRIIEDKTNGRIIVYRDDETFFKTYANYNNAILFWRENIEEEYNNGHLLLSRCEYYFLKNMWGYSLKED